MADTGAYVLIKTKPGAAADVAKMVSELGPVHWAAVVTGPYDIIAGVRVSDNEMLGTLVVERIRGISGVIETMTAVMVSFHRGKVPRGIMAPP
ncbi:MAG: Lrp/AsnC ligand binding domain-containing protein [Anaerolineales bacterium]|nr:Lrp/AsnC ligand binding domain-containing protein [Anaerolineales bacterium]